MMVQYITVRNRVMIAPQSAEKRPLSHIELTAPVGRYDWLNQNIYVGTLNPQRPASDAVLIRVFRLV